MPDGLPFSPFEVRDDSNPSGDGLSHLNRIKLGGAATSAMANWVAGFVMEIFRNNLGAWLKDSSNPPNNIFIAFCFAYQAVLYDMAIPVLVCTSFIINFGVRLMSEPISVTTSLAT